MRTYKVFFLDGKLHILAIETVSCATVGMAVSLACDSLDNKNEHGILADARNLKVELQ
jgi:hypothetical protein